MLTTHPCQGLLDSLQAVIIGKEPTLKLVVATLLAGGHVLLEDVPGVGKTLLARTLAQAVGGAWKRVQFSPDLLPSDITGVNVFNPASGEFRFVPGPIFANVLLADEINRASPRTQSSLLEAMEESRVTVDGETHTLAPPFLVIATQNPLEHHGTYPLPEAQLDRFAIAVSLGYPTPDEEQRLLARSIGAQPSGVVEAAISPQDLAVWQASVRQVRVDDSLQGYIVRVAQRSREHGQISIGISPRGSLLWLRLSQAMAWLEGRDFVTPDDIRRTAVPVLAHRIQLAHRTGSGARRDVVAELLGEIAVPD
ncbi:MAG: MoxR-like ATPase [Cyanobacteria bacterium RYN_339]|nr:MoxR-like ATPase [Cyanobacteria bacterium RYN_339]